MGTKIHVSTFRSERTPCPHLSCSTVRSCISWSFSGSRWVSFLKSPLFCMLCLSCKGSDYKPKIPAHRNLNIEILANETWSQLPEIPKQGETLGHTFWSWDRWAYGFTSLVRATFQMMYCFVLSNHFLIQLHILYEIIKGFGCYFTILLSLITVWIFVQEDT